MKKILTYTFLLLIVAIALLASAPAYAFESGFKQLSSPDNNYTQITYTTFQWDALKKSRSYKIRVFDVEKNMVFKSKWLKAKKVCKRKLCEVILPMTLKPGVYIWRIVGRDAFRNKKRGKPLLFTIEPELAPWLQFDLDLTNTPEPTATPQSDLVPTLTPKTAATPQSNPVPTITPETTATLYSDPAPTNTPEPLSSTYFVAPTGSDSNSGAEANPWQTIQKAADSLQPGDTVTVRAGNYPERILINRSGAVNAPITFQVQGSVITQGFTILADHITVRGFEITNTPNDSTHGVGIFAQGNHCILEDNYIHYATQGGILVYAEPSNYSRTNNCIVRNNRLYRNSQMGIEVSGLDHLVEDNEIWGTIQHHPTWTNAPEWVDADGIKFFGSGHTFRGNYIHDILYSDPLNINPHIDCFQTFSGGDKQSASNILIERNRCDNSQAQSGEDSGTGFMIQLAQGDIIIRNNLVNAFVGAYISNANGVTIVNNTFVSDLTFNTSFWPVGVTVLDSSDITVMNNIFYDHPWRVIDVDIASALQGGHNLVYRSDDYTPVTVDTYDHSNDLWGLDPLFHNPHVGNYNLRPSSPAIGASSDGSDIGASEFLVPQ